MRRVDLQQAIVVPIGSGQLIGVERGISDVVPLSADQRRLGEVEDAVALGLRQDRPQRQHQRAELPGSRRQQDVLGRVPQADHDRRSLADTAFGQQARDLVRPPIERPPAHDLVVAIDRDEDDGRFVRMEVGQLGDPATERQHHFVAHASSHVFRSSLNRPYTTATCRS
jgi:hypothetical protein